MGPALFASVLPDYALALGTAAGSLVQQTGAIDPLFGHLRRRLIINADRGKDCVQLLLQVVEVAAAGMPLSLPQIRSARTDDGDHRV